MGDNAVIATADHQMRDAAQRWCAAAGATPTAVDSVDAVRREWRDAAIVFIGQDLAAEVARIQTARRDHVVVIAHDPDVVWRAAVRLGACAVVDPHDDATALEALAAALDGRIEGCTVSVVGGSGGVGASTFAAALGLRAAGRGLAAVLLDADPGGAGVDIILGSENAEGLRWPDLAAVDGRVSGESLADVLPRHEGLATVSWPTSAAQVEVPSAAPAVWSAAGRAFDLVVADAPRAVESQGWSRAVMADSLLTVVVIGEDLASVGAARKVAARATEACASVVAVTVTRRGGLGADAVAEASRSSGRCAASGPTHQSAAVDRPRSRTAALSLVAAWGRSRAGPARASGEGRSTVTPDVVERVRHRLVMDAVAPTATTVADALRAERQVVSGGDVLALVDRLRSEMLGAGPLDAVLALPGVTDVLVNGAAQVFADCGEGLEPVDVRFDSEDVVRRLAQRMAAIAGRRLDDASPWVDARLPDGTRLHAVLAPIARPGTVISLRVPSRRLFSVDDLQARGMFDGGAGDHLRRIMEARSSFVVTGGTGSGKTTVLAALLAIAEPRDRVVIVEDSTELRPDHPHVVGLEARPANVEGAGCVTVRDLVRQALRMRPDRLVVGEVRGAEVVDLLSALNTGHEGGCGTLHANSASDVPARFEALGVAAGLARDAVHSQLAAGVDLVVHLGRDDHGVRRVREIAVLESVDGWVQAVSALVFDGPTSRRGPGFDRYQSLIS